MHTQILQCRELTPAQQRLVAQDLQQGAVAALATDTVYGLGTGAFCEASVQTIYALKNRPAGQPLQLLVPSIEAAVQIAQISSSCWRVVKAFWPGGLTLILPATQAGKPLLRGSTGLGLRMPAYAPLLELLAQMSMPLACTSANLHNRPVLTHAQEVINQFDGKVNYILLDGTLSPTASTVLDATVEPPRCLRSGTIAPDALERVYRGE